MGDCCLVKLAQSYILKLVSLDFTSHNKNTPTDNMWKDKSQSGSSTYYLSREPDKCMQNISLCFFLHISSGFILVLVVICNTNYKDKHSYHVVGGSHQEASVYNANLIYNISSFYIFFNKYDPTILKCQKKQPLPMISINRKMKLISDVSSLRLFSSFSKTETKAFVDRQK